MLCPLSNNHPLLSSQNEVFLSVPGSNFTESLWYWLYWWPICIPLFMLVMLQLKTWTLLNLGGCCSWFWAVLLTAKTSKVLYNLVRDFMNPWSVLVLSLCWSLNSYRMPCCSYRIHSGYYVYGRICSTCSYDGNSRGQLFLYFSLHCTLTDLRGKNICFYCNYVKEILRYM